MKAKTLRTLEYDKIIRLLEDKAESELGKEKVREIAPIKDIEEINRLQEETSEAYQILVKRTAPPLFGIYNLDREMKRLKMGGYLEPYNLLKISDSLRVCRRLKAFMRDRDMDRESEYPILENMIDSLETHRSIEEEINRSIISEDEISDDASGALRNIRRDMKRKNDDVRKKLDSIIKSSAYERYLQDSIVTVREGRYVVPVKQEHRSSIPGIVHDISGSGATAFIEPMSVVNLNNELRELDIKEKQEIQVILERLSYLVSENSHDIILNQQILQGLDFIFAKGKLALDMNAVKPVLNDERYLNIKQARHPLLDKKNVVPIDIYMGKEFNTLVITGPNTGGKTVTLKTVGLLTLMAQSGIHIPADFGSEIGVFKDIYVDIGDEQSIEQSLSTFSSHMTNIVSILDGVGKDSLVLFDELGAGTDPTEGAALAMAILDNLLKRDIRTIATTHYSQLKVYALTTDDVNNASVEFDVETLSPTYKLLIGVPGKSNAFEISQRLGLQDYIIRDAQNLISKENVEFEDVLQAMEEDRLEAEENRRESEKYRREVEELQEELREKQAKTEEMRDKIISRANREAREILRRSKEDADKLIKELREISTDIEKDRNKEMQKIQDELQSSIGDIDAELSEDVLNVKSNKPPEDLKPGETVKVLAYDQIGEVLTEPDAKGDIQVQVGIMKINTNVSKVKRSKSEEEEKIETKTRHILSSKAQDIKREIDLRGMNLDEAILDVDKYLDDAYISRLGEVEIIHGKGTGVLRSGISGYLRTHRHVKDFRLGEYGEGGDGVTIVTLK